MAAIIASGAHDAEGEDWRAVAEAGIAEHRQAALVVEVVDAKGEPVPDAQVRVEMTRHAFRFGTAVSAMKLGPVLLGEEGETQDTDWLTYRDKITEHFNAAVLENGHKWRWWEAPKDREKTVATTRWLLDQGLDVRGHTLIWQHRKKSWSMPNDVFDSEDHAYIRKRVADRISQAITHEYGARGRLPEWDLLNEQWSEHVLTDKLDPDSPKEQAPSLIEWFNTAHKAAPEVRLYINDYGILVGDKAEHRASYEKTIRYLMDNDAPLHGIGFQAHFVNGQSTPSIDAVRERLDRFAAFGVPLLITEFDMFGKGWEDGQKAQWLRDFMTVCFSHPGIDGFIMWGFWDGKHWADNAPLYDKDWNLKPEGEAWMQLVFDQWWTDENGNTDARGRWQTRAFLGEHRVTVTGPGGEMVQREAVVTRGRDNRVVVELAGQR